MDARVEATERATYSARVDVVGPKRPWEGLRPVLPARCQPGLFQHDQPDHEAAGADAG